MITGRLDHFNQERMLIPPKDYQNIIAFSGLMKRKNGSNQPIIIALKA